MSDVDPPPSCHDQHSLHDCLVIGYDCGWCSGYLNITGDNRCIGIVDWCDNYDDSTCQTFQSDETCSDASLEWFMMAIMLCVFVMMLTFHETAGHEQRVCTKEGTLYYCIFITFFGTILGVIIWTYIKSNSIGDFFSTAISILIFIPFEAAVFVGTIFAFIYLIKWTIKLAMRPVCKCGLMSLVFIVGMIIVSGIVLSLIEAISEYELISAVLFLSISLLGVDIIQLTFEAQTKQTKLWIINAIKNVNNGNQEHVDDNAINISRSENERNVSDVIVSNKVDVQIFDAVEEEEKYPDSHQNIDEKKDPLSESLISDHDHHQNIQQINQNLSKFLIGELFVFVSWVIVFVTLSILYEEKESCFMNLAAFAPAITNCIIWICHNKNTNCFKCCIPFLILFCLILVILIVTSCTCAGDDHHCVYLHITFGIMVLAWGFVVMIQSCLKSSNVK